MFSCAQGTEHRRVLKSVANYVIGPPGLVSSTALYGNSTNLWIPLSSLFFNLVGVDSMPLDLRYSNSARCAVETRTDGPPRITDEVRVSSNQVYKAAQKH
jgi:hypothetical protein